MGRINQLTPTTTLSANSVIAMDAESGGATNKVTIQTLASGLRSFGNYATQTDLNRKQDVLTFDDSPKNDSNNPVTSGGIYNAIAQSTATEATGSYKSPNGTLIQWGGLSGKSGDRISFTIPFVGDNPTVQLTPAYNSISTIRCILSANPTLTDFLLTAYDASTSAVSTSTTLQARWLAIGRWK